jgi:hypothetical protein
VANTILGLLIELARAPVHAAKLYEELQTLDNLSDSKELGKLPYLNACIVEVLRIYPALVTGGQRKTTKNGVTIAGTFIPPETTIVAPQWVISRSKSHAVSHSFLQRGHGHFAHRMGLTIDLANYVRLDRRGLLRPAIRVYPRTLDDLPGTRTESCSHHTFRYW